MQIEIKVPPIKGEDAVVLNVTGLGEVDSGQKIAELMIPADEGRHLIINAPKACVIEEIIAITGHIVTEGDVICIVNDES